MKNNLFNTLLLTLIIGLGQSQAQFYNQGAEVTIQSGATVTVEGDFVNASGSNFKNSGTIEIKKYVTNNQVMTNDFGGYWKFNGNTLQKISGTEPIWINALNINNPDGFLLQNSLIINKQMEFANGIMTADLANNVVIFSKNAQPATPLPTNTSHINGAVIKEGELETFKYPVGDGIKYQPIQVTFEDNGNENGLLGKYNPTDAGLASFGGNGTETTFLNKYNFKEYWNLTPVNNGITKGKVTVFWDSYNDSFTDGVSLRRVAHLSGSTGKWENEGTNAGVGTVANGSVQSNIISSWSPFTLGTVAPVALPLRLLTFTGKKVSENNLLYWSTTHEKNVSHFEIEKSTDAKAFEKIGKVNTNFVTKENTSYEFIDYQPGTLLAYRSSFYRLKIVDIDGKYDYSKIINIANDDENAIVGDFYPNPAIDNFAHIDVNSIEKGTWTVSHFNTAGRLLNVETKEFEKGINTFTVHNLPKGVSIFQFQNSTSSVRRKLIH